MATPPAAPAPAPGGVDDEEAPPMLDFDMLCASVALSSERGGKSPAAAVEVGNEWDFPVAGAGAGVQRMWEGDLVLGCLEDRRAAVEAALCPCYVFGKNMRRANLGSCFLQASVFSILSVAALGSFIAFSITMHHAYLFLGVGIIVLVGIYTGYYRTRLRKQFNILGNDGSFDDCMVHIMCPCCALCQESRTLQVNVHNGIWHGRGDTICLQSSSEKNNAFAAICETRFASKLSPELCNMERTPEADTKHSWDEGYSQSEPLVPTAQEQH